KEVAQCLTDFESKVDEVLKTWQGLRFIGLATNPVNSLDQLDVIPAPRYHIMTEVLGKTGTLGTSMMRRTSSVQINLDYTSEAEAIEMLRVALAVAPLSIALFANSPFLDGKNTGFLSMRAEIWRHTDPSRTGLLPGAFEGGFDFSAYSAYLWRMPLMFVQTDEGHFISAKGCSLADIAAGKLLGVSIQPQTLRTAVQQLFTEARLKPGYVEVRSVDGQLPPYRLASTAFWLGLLYDSSARQKSLELLGGLNTKERNALWVEASRVGLKAKVKDQGFQNIAETLVDLSQKHLKNRGFGEEMYLQPLIKNIEQGLCPAEWILKKFKSEWHESYQEMLKGEI
ncbi:MAG: glutamate-cysteine ligase family protein, partial [Deltaproteobacteria bacterium]